jgi:hypothetical protein
MELSKYEKRLLDPRSPARNRVILLIGILFIAMSFFVLLFNTRITERLYKPFQKMSIDTQNIITQSQREELLKQSLLETIKVAELGWYKYSESLRQSVFMLLFIFGAILIAGSWQNKRVHRLLKKLNIGSQQAAPPDRQ